jgi:hypothetical protein
MIYKDNYIELIDNNLKLFKRQIKVNYPSLSKINSKIKQIFYMIEIGDVILVEKIAQSIILLEPNNLILVNIAKTLLNKICFKSSLGY